MAPQEYALSMNTGKIIIREAIETDVLGVYALYKRHLDNKEYGAKISYNQEKLLIYTEDAIRSSNIMMYVSVLPKEIDIITGVISGTIIECPFSDEKICRELTWINDPKYPSRGLALLRTLERWGKKMGASVTVLGCTDEKVSRLLSARKYLKSELTYERNF